MKCTECGHENLIKAKYCAKCGHPFTEEQRKAAYNATIFGKLDMMKKAKSYATLSFITGQMWFKVLMLAIVILYGILTHANQGTKMKILESDAYTVDHNTQLNEYYLYTDLDELTVQLYVPGKPSGVEVHTCADDGTEISAKTFALSDPIVLMKQDGVQYRIDAVYDNDSRELTVLVYDSAEREAFAAKQ